MQLKVLKVTEQQSRQGGTFFYVFFKSLDSVGNPKSYKTCIYPAYGNFKRWQSLIQMVQRGYVVTIINAKTIGSLVDADSLFIITEAVKADEAAIGDQISAPVVHGCAIQARN